MRCPALCPRDGDILGLSGVFGGMFSFSRGALFSSSKATGRQHKHIAIRVSFAAPDTAEESNRGGTYTPTHSMPCPIIFESI
jgi:hypothetical protein